MTARFVLTIVDPDYRALWDEAQATGKSVPQLIAKAVHRYTDRVPSRPLLEWVQVIDSPEVCP